MVVNHILIDLAASRSRDIDKSLILKGQEAEKGERGLGREVEKQRVAEGKRESEAMGLGGRRVFFAFCFLVLFIKTGEASAFLRVEQEVPVLEIAIN